MSPATVVHGSAGGVRACNRGHRYKAEPDVVVATDPRTITCKNKACDDVRKRYELDLHQAARTLGDSWNAYGTRRGILAAWTCPPSGPSTVTLPLATVHVDPDGVVEFANLIETAAFRDLLHAGIAAAEAIDRTLRVRQSFGNNPLALERIEEIRAAEAVAS